MHLLIFWEEGEGSRNSRTFTPDRRCDHVKIAGGGHCAHMFAGCRQVNAPGWFFFFFFDRREPAAGGRGGA